MYFPRHAFLIAVLLAPFAARAGAWGSGSFENDDALEWVADCVRTSGGSSVATALTRVADARYMEAPEASVAVAAAEVVAAARGKASPKLPPDLWAWLQKQPKAEIAELAPSALKAMERVARGPSSELATLWKQSESHFAWQQGMQDLLARLR